MIVRAVVVSLLVGAFACRGSEDSPVRFEGETMGTTYVVLVADELSQSERIGLRRGIAATLDDIDRRMSHYIPDSELSRFNRLEAGVPFRISTETFEVFREAIRVSELTGGAFDVTVAPLVRLWGFGPGAAAREPPPEEALASAGDRVGYQFLRLDDDAQTLTKEVKGLEADLSGIAKGYAVDRVAELLIERRVGNFMIEVGGEVRTLGKNSAGEAWRIAIEAPRATERAIQRVLPLSGLSLATSGDYRNFYEVDGKLYSHLLDPRSGRPVAHRLASVSVVDHTCMRADALASGLLVLGPEEGFRLAVAEDLAVLFLVRSESGEIEERPTPSFAQLFF